MGAYRWDAETESDSGKLAWVLKIHEGIELRGLAAQPPSEPD